MIVLIVLLFYVQIISIRNSSAPNATMSNVNVTFQVLNATEPVPSYHVIQTIEEANITLDQALGYTVLPLL